jgi:pyridoxal phosphate enzyme (YggS family)
MPVTRAQIRANVEAIGTRIDEVCARVGRDPTGVLLVAAAKRQPFDAISWAAEAGVTAVGENYVRELRDVRDRVPGVRWHYIGALQTNTVHHVAALADVVETAAGQRATERLARRAAGDGRILDTLIEVDFTGARAGVPPAQVPAFADEVASLDGLRLRGLMTIPPPTQTAGEARPWFRRLRELLDRVHSDHPDVLDLSMGMSLDYEVAIEEGATMVRIGTAVFGPRTP